MEVKVPDIGDFDAVPVIEVLVAVGDEVAVEDPLVVLESDKATMEVPSPAAGKVTDITVAVGDKVAEGSVLLTLEGDARGGQAGHRRAGRGGRGAEEARATPPAARPGRRRQRPGRGARRRPGRLHGGVPRRRPRPVASP